MKSYMKVAINSTMTKNKKNNGDCRHVEIVIIRALLVHDVIRRNIKGEHACASILFVNHRSRWE